MKNLNEEIKKVNGGEELDDDMLDGVAGGIVQLINPSSGSLYRFKDGTVCQYCGDDLGKYKNGYMKCDDCGKNMVNRKVDESELKHVGGGIL